MTSGLPSGSILIVEDEPIVRMLVVDHLTDLGYATIEAQDAPSALPVLEGEGDIALLLTDVGLPGMDGRQLAEAARGIRPDLRILFATGDAHGVTTWPGYSPDTMDLVGKPFDMDDLAGKVEALMRG